MSTQSRLPWPQYFMEITYLVAERSTCIRRKVGAIAVKDRRILATGYNGAPAGVAHCLDVGCLRARLGVPSGQRHEICRGLHAEQNVIVQAAIHGVSLAGSEIYCTTQPCLICTKMLINCGVTAIRYVESYPDQLAEDMLRESGVPLEALPFLPRTAGPCLGPDDPAGTGGNSACGNGGGRGGCACGGRQCP